MSYESKHPVIVIGGENAVEDYGGMMKQLGEKSLIVTGKNSAKKSGALSDVTDSFERWGGVSYSVFDSVTENPLTETCFQAGQKAREEKADFIVGIGGGSALDAAKAVAVYASNPQISSPDLIYSEPVKNKPLPVVLIGTTAGTGSEVTRVSVLTNTKGKKKSVKGDNYYAALVFADAKYTHSLPYSVTVSTALDAFCHATESYFSALRTDISSKNAEKALSLIWKELCNFEKSDNLPDNDARERLYDGSLYAGAAIDITGCCFPHTVGYYLTEKHGVSHGRACAVFLPEFVRRGCAYMPETAKAYFDIIDTDFAEFERIILTLADVKVKVDRDILESYLINWYKVANFVSSPGSYTPELARGLILGLFG